ncbi:4-hydroxyphenylpyruvate dioxygenase family protein [Leptothoe kymatousa]|uniref:VOC family protein n=1 Tax=Leptothoe kymatousa TAU-MAC 1615 TaxID=2364775 RepID=A0ABS5Y1I8_9CYAN|nr:VOC family protein [Leptothoe kymatousa]MBT9311687.1 VOC family protein [Leptothoe kymatousa TAU-MAC 1615]
MKIDHIHFFVEDAIAQRRWFANYLGWTPEKSLILPDRMVEILRYRHTFFVVSSPRRADSPVADYLRHHPPGVADVAIAVDDLAAMFSRVKAKQHTSGSFATILDHLTDLRHQTHSPVWTRIEGWPGIQHTLIEHQPPATYPLKHLPQAPQDIDHVVLNVPQGQLQAATTFYQHLLGLQKQQSFKIQTDRSGLQSQVLFCPENQVYLNINEPTSKNSQIQTFLDVNQGAGIQHIALHGDPIVATVAALRRRGMALLAVSRAYYDQLQQRLQTCPRVPMGAEEWQQIVEQQILIDWQLQKPESLLLQTFTRPIFAKNHFFFEFIERRCAAKGFGEGNFLALYQAIEAAEAEVLGVR